MSSYRQLLGNLYNSRTHYEEESGTRHPRVAKELVEHVRLSKGMTVLDAATGTGLVARLAAERVGPTGRVLGIDISPVMLQQAREKMTLSQSNIEYRLGDVVCLEFAPACLDAIFCCEAFVLFEDPLKVLQTWHRALKPSGLLSFTCTSELSYSAEWLRVAWEEVLDSPMPPSIHQRMGKPERIHEMLSQAGFFPTQIRRQSSGRYGLLNQWICGRDRLLLMLKGNVLVEHLSEAQVYRVCETWKQKAQQTPTGGRYWEDTSLFFVYAEKS